MLDLNDLRVFEKVAMLGSFSAASRSLGMPKSSVSRSVARLENEFGVPLLQRTTRQVVLTQTGRALQERCGELLGRLREIVDYVESMTGRPRGMLKISAGIGFGINVLAHQLPAFLARFPDVSVNLDLTSKLGNPIAEGIDAAIRLGPLPDSGLKCIYLGSIQRCLCAAPAYLKRAGKPRTIQDIADHDTIEMPRGDGRPREWTFDKDGKTARIELNPRVIVNEALTIHRLVLSGVGLGVISGYLCGPEIKCGKLVHLFPDWVAPPIEVNLVFPSNRESSPMVRAFATFMKDVTRKGELWLKNPE